MPPRCRSVRWGRPTWLNTPGGCCSELSTQLMTETREERLQREFTVRMNEAAKVRELRHIFRSPQRTGQGELLASLRAVVRQRLVASVLLHGLSRHCHQAIRVRLSLLQIRTDVSASLLFDLFIDHLPGLFVLDALRNLPNRLTIAAQHQVRVDLPQLLLWFLAHTGLKGLVGPMYLASGTMMRRPTGLGLKHAAVDLAIGETIQRLCTHGVDEEFLRFPIGLFLIKAI
mmetsp:Transcript_62928/g.99830  ORF Transcript_62928/g.99830 Transcript_62928/m.99830 type:complete len:229 (-) Transcript_62928:465-1151(-)